MPWPPELPPNRDVNDTLKTTGLPLRDESLEEIVMSGSDICRLFRLRLRKDPCLVLLPLPVEGFSLLGFSSDESLLSLLLLPPPPPPPPKLVGLLLPHIQFHLFLRTLLFRCGVAPEEEAEVAERPTVAMPLSPPLLGLSHRPNGVRSLKSRDPRLLGVL